MTATHVSDTTARTAGSTDPAELLAPLDTFARRLMDKPASYFYSVLWNKLYRREMLLAHDIRFTSEMRWGAMNAFSRSISQTCLSSMSGSASIVLM